MLRHFYSHFLILFTDKYKVYVLTETKYIRNFCSICCDTSWMAIFEEEQLISWEKEGEKKTFVNAPSVSRPCVILSASLLWEKLRGTGRKMGEERKTSERRGRKHKAVQWINAVNRRGKERRKGGKSWSGKGRSLCIICSPERKY